MIKGDKFRRFFQKIIAKKNYLQILKRKNYPFFLIEILLNNGVSDSEFLKDKKKMEKIKSLLTEMGISSSLSADEEHGLYELAVDFRVNGMKVSCKVNLDLIRSVEFKGLSKIHKELETFKPPFHIVATSEKVKIDNEAKLLDYLFHHTHGRRCRASKEFHRKECS